MGFLRPECRSFLSKLTLSLLAGAFAAVLLCALPAAARDDIGSLFSRGLEKENEGDCIGAIYIFRDVLERNRYFVDAKIALARCYYKTGNLADGEELLKDALKQERNNLAARNLLGRVYISMGRFEDAEKAFRGSIAVEPANIEAKYGLADLFRVKGEFQRAVAIYEEVVKLYPQEAWTYIHLGNCFTEMGELDRAGGYFRKAVSLDSQSMWTHLNLARYYYRMGVREDGSAMNPAGAAAADRFFEAALHEADTAREMERTSAEPLRVTAAVHFYRRRFPEALEAYRKLFATGQPVPGPQGSLLLYETGYCHEMIGDLEDAETAYADALARRIDDEITRFRLEEVTLALHRESLSEKNRIELSDFHERKARFNLEKNVMDKAALQYRRAIQLDPLNPAKRLGLANVYLTRRFYERYVFELKDIVRDTLGVNTVDLNDRIEIYESRIRNSLASRWRVSQYGEDEKAPGWFPRTKTRIAVFDAFSSDYIAEDFLHRRLSMTFSEMLSLQLGTYAKIEVVNAPGPVESRQDALKRALLLGADYYLTGSLEEREDSLKAAVSLNSGFNGKAVARFDTYFTGNDKVFNTVFSVASSVNGAVPLVGQIVRLEGNRALLNLGTAQGVQKDMAFHIFRKGGLKKSPETGELIADAEVALGRLTVTTVDETVAEGTYTYSGLHDRVNVYDSVVRAREEKKEGASAPDGP